MATQADIGKWTFSVGATPTVVGEVLSVSELGTTNSLLDVTSFSSPSGRMEYISGLSDGSEISIECNRVPGDAGQLAIKTAVLAQATESFVLAYGGTTAATYTFDAVCMSEVLNPSISEQNKVSYSVKVSGDIVET
jgi:hypothetical protein